MGISGKMPVPTAMHLRRPQIPRNQNKTKTTVIATAKLTDQRKPAMSILNAGKPVTLLEIYTVAPRFSYTEIFQTVPCTIKHAHPKALEPHPQVPIGIICMHKHADGATFTIAF